jgi:hypothetical protein
MATKDNLLQLISSYNAIIASTLETSSHAEVIERLQQCREELLEMKNTLEEINENDINDETRTQVTQHSFSYFLTPISSQQQKRI